MFLNYLLNKIKVQMFIKGDKFYRILSNSNYYDFFFISE